LSPNVFSGNALRPAALLFLEVSVFSVRYPGRLIDSDDTPALSRSRLHWRNAVHMDLVDELLAVVRALEAARVPYAICGGARSTQSTRVITKVALGTHNVARPPALGRLAAR
jgi:hypothetical protein